MRRKTQRKRTSKKKTRRVQKGGDPLPDTSALNLEFLFNDFMYEKYERYYFEETDPEQIEEKKQESKAYMQSIQSFVDDVKGTDSIPYSIHTIPEGGLGKYLRQNINEEDDVCKGKIDLGKITTSFYAQRPAICILLKNDSHIIGIAIFSFTHRHIQHKFGNKINTAKKYISIDWLCGSKYNKVGTILTDTIEKIQQHMKTNSTYLISYNSAIPFYTKKGFEYLGLSRVGTPMMEKKRTPLTPNSSGSPLAGANLPGNSAQGQSAGEQ